MVGGVSVFSLKCYYYQYYFWFSSFLIGKVHERGKRNSEIISLSRFVALKLDKQFSSKRMQRNWRRQER